MTDRHRNFLGWSAVGLSTLAGCFWAFWGVIENFHEGWFHRSLWMNLGLMLAQYLLLMEMFVGAALVAIRWPRIGGAIHIAAALTSAWFFRGASSILLNLLIAGPLGFLGIAYWVGRPEPRRWAAAAVAGLPLIAVVAVGAEPALRAAGRVDDGNHAARRVTATGVDLTWAPEGPGWPRTGVTWEEAQRRCQYLTEDGMSLAEEPQAIWRLPTVEEAVRSMLRHGQNCGGAWDPSVRKTSYKLMPDKESPLWDVYSPVIYWWTGSEVNDQEAYIVVYDGKVWPRPKRAHWGYLGFRAVRDN